MISINNIHHFDAEIASAGDKLGSTFIFHCFFLVFFTYSRNFYILVIVDFGANWCGPCKLIAPHFERLANEYSDTALFLKVDVDECEDVALNQGVSALPTFVFFRNKEVVDRIQGSRPMELEEKVRSYVNVRDEDDHEEEMEEKSSVSHVSSVGSVETEEEEKTLVTKRVSSEKERKSVDKNTVSSSLETRTCCFKFKKHSH